MKTYYVMFTIATAFVLTGCAPDKKPETAANIEPKSEQVAVDTTKEQITVVSQDGQVAPQATPVESKEAVVPVTQEKAPESTPVPTPASTSTPAVEPTSAVEAPATK